MGQLAAILSVSQHFAMWINVTSIVRSNEFSTRLHAENEQIINFLYDWVESHPIDKVFFLTNGHITVIIQDN